MNFRPLINLAASAVVYLAATGSLSAQIFAKDDASSYTNPPGNTAWMSLGTSNAGFGFTPWVFTRAGSDFQGFFVSTGDSIGSTNGKYWGHYANGSHADNASVAYRGFTNALSPGTVFKLKWHTLGVGGQDASHRGGFSLRHGNANASTADLDTGTRFDFSYVGNNGQDFFLIQDGSGVTPTSLHFTDNPFQLELTLLTVDTYRLVVKDGTGATTLATYDNLNLAGSPGDTIDSVALFAVQTDGNQVWNNLEISSASLLPPEVQNVSPTNGAIYITAATQVSFDVVSLFSTVSSNGIKLSLNGVNQTNLAFSGMNVSAGSSTNWHVTLNSTLSNNLVYTGVITAQDANGNRATNTFSFNTWRSDNPFIEAEDYNYSSGSFPPDSFPPSNAGAGQVGDNGVDYLEYDNGGNAYRGDLVQVEPATDVDHANLGANFYGDYNVAFIKNGEFENYTRVMTNVSYDVYARMAGFGNSATMLAERLVNPTAAVSNQPRAALGTFVCPNTGGPQNWTFVPLKDMFSQPVAIHVSGTNTFRLTCLGADENYNFNYLIFVPSTNSAATLRPYLSSGYPFPGAANVFPNQNLSFTIANRQTAVTPASIQLSLNSNNVTGSIALSNNAAGSVVSYQPPTLLPAGTNTMQVVFSDGTVSQTNFWQFTVAALPTLPAANALPVSQAGAPGFAIQIAKADDSSPPADFPPTIARAKAHLAGLIIDSNTQLPYPNLALGTNNGFFDETNTINYDINATPTANSTFQFKTNFPYVPANGTNNFMSMAANMYVQLTPGVWTFVVRSDDGFQVTSSTNFSSTNVTLGLFDGGRGDNNPSSFSFIVTTAGLYPMRLIYDQGEFGGNIELYSAQSGQNVLLNDLSNPNAVKVYRTVSAPIQLFSPAHSGHTTTFSFQSESGKSYTVLYKNGLNDPVWLTNQTVSGTGSVVNVSDTTATTATRFYRVRSP